MIFLIKKQYARWIELGLLLLLAVIISGMTALERQQQNLSDSLIRLHVTADSDDPEDQEMKLLVRDAVLLDADILTRDAKGRNEAKAILSENLEKLEETANRVLTTQGVDDTVKVSLKRELFGTRFYNGRALPGGYYDALRVEIGSGEGHNWWCVVYPQLCVPAVTEQTFQPVMAPGDGSSWIVSEEMEEYELKFMLLELFENLVGWFRAGTDGIPDSG